MSEKPRRRYKLSVLVLGAIILMYSLASFVQLTILINNIGSYTTKNYLEECRILTDNFSNLISTEMEKYTRQLDFYVNTEVVKSGSSEAIFEWLKGDGRGFRSSDFDYVAYVDAKGDFYSDNGSKTTVNDRDYFEAIMKKGFDIYISSAALSKTTGENIVHVCKAVRSGNSVTGFITAIVPVSHFQAQVNKLVLGDTGRAIITSGDGNFIATSGDMQSIVSMMSDPSPEITNQLKDNMAKLAKGQGGEYWLHYGNVNKDFYNVFRPVDGTDWAIFFMIDKSQVMASSVTIRKIVSSLCGLCGLIMMIVIFILISKSLKPISVVNASIHEIASGHADLTKRIEINDRTEVGSVVDGFNIFTGKLQDIVISLKGSKNVLMDTGEKLKESTSNTSSSITEITACIENLGSNITHQTASVVETSTAINQISANIESLNKMVVVQSSNVTEASAAVTQMISNIDSVNRSVARMANSFSELEARSVEGVKKQSDVNDRIKLIEAESQTLQEANAVISNIAEQTNLLAMNAAIEAAHAGESGKGFSVVADEIRKLSETSSAQSKTIGMQLQKIADSINGIVEASKDAQISFSSVSNGISSTDGVVQEIKNAMCEQEEGSKQITIALKNMTDSTSEVTNASTEMAEGAKAILEEVKNLQENTTSMKEAMDEMSVGAKKINETGAVLHELSGLVANSIDDISKQVDQFIV